MMTKTDFKKWYEEYTKPYDKQNVKLDIDTWFEKVDRNHSIIRRMIGGSTAEHLNINYKNPKEHISNEMISDIIIQIERISSDVQHLSVLLNRSMLKKPRYELDDGRKKQEMSTSTYINKYIMNALKNLHTSKDELLRVQNSLNTIFSSVGVAWSILGKEITVDVEIKTEPESFVKLGHYGPDNGSCFRFGGENVFHKFVLGQANDTFVLLVKKDSIPIARYWGFFNKDHETINLCNGYYTGIDKEYTDFVISKFIMEKFKLKNKHKGCIDIDPDLIYHNERRPELTFSHADFLSGKQELTIDTEGLFEMIECHGCGEIVRSDRCIASNESLYCRDCFEATMMCDNCGRVRFFEEDGAYIVNIGYSCPICVETMGVVDCPMCSRCFVPDLPTQENENITCPSCRYSFTRG